MSQSALLSTLLGLIIFSCSSFSLGPAGVAAEVVEAGKVTCYVCDSCNSVNIATTRMEAGTYCRKSVILGETSRAAVDSCIAIPKVTYCCQGNLCNSASSIKSLGLRVTAAAAAAAVMAVSAVRLLP